MKRVIVEMKIKAVAVVPDDWDKDNVEFLLNESSHCASNEFEALAEKWKAAEDNDLCFGCAFTEFEYKDEYDPDNSHHTELPVIYGEE